MKKLFAVTLLSIAVTTPALAADTGFYIGGQIGRSSDSTSTLDSSSYGITLGYQLSQNWGIEGGYASLYNITTSQTTNVGGGITMTSNVNTHGTDMFAAAVYTLPLNNQFSVLGRLGYNSLSTTVNASCSFSNGNPCTFFGANNSTASGLLYGLAGQYNLTAQVGVRAGLDYYNLSANGASATLHNMNASVVYKF